MLSPTAHWKGVTLGRAKAGGYVCGRSVAKCVLSHSYPCECVCVCVNTYRILSVRSTKHTTVPALFIIIGYTDTPRNTDTHTYSPFLIKDVQIPYTFTPMASFMST